MFTETTTTVCSENQTNSAHKRHGQNILLFNVEACGTCSYDCHKKLKQTLKKRGMRIGLCAVDSFDSVYDSVVGSCKHNKLSGSVKLRNFTSTTTTSFLKTLRYVVIKTYTSNCYYYYYYYYHHRRRHHNH